MIVVRCKQCNKEITSSDTQTRSCGCPNMMTVIGDSITASNLSQTIIVRRIDEKKEKDKKDKKEKEKEEPICPSCCCGDDEDSSEEEAESDDEELYKVIDK